MTPLPPSPEAKGVRYSPPFQRNPRLGSRYDLFVDIMQIMLPIISAGLLMTLLIWPLINQQEMSFVLSKDRVETSPERLRMEEPRYKGLDSKGRSFEISAMRAVQKSSSTPVVELTKVAAKIQLSDGEARLFADKGSYDMTSEHLKVMGTFRLDSDNGYHFVTHDAEVDLPRRTAYGVSGIEGSGPLGRFSAQGFRANIEKETVVIEGRAHLRITPSR